MTLTDESSFLSVPQLLANSQPRARPAWGWYIAGAFLLVTLIGTWAGNQYPGEDLLVRFCSALLMMAMIGGLVVYANRGVRSARQRQQQLEGVEELVQLRHWPQAAAMLHGMLSVPMSSAQARVQALIYLTTVLGRYHRFSDAIQVQEHLLEHFRLDPGTTHALKVGRAMAMLRENRLFDVDRAINDLRRSPEAAESAGLALVEMYRDVITGHPQEALEIFDAKLPVMRKQLGTRVGDAYVLAARAYDLLDRNDQARAAYASATLLSAAVELHRRYPETASLAQKYAPPAPSAA